MTDSSRDRPARIEDITDAATAMPDVVRAETNGRPSYSVDGKVFVFHREPRKDAFDPETGERYDDVIAFYVADLDTKDALVNDEGTPWFTTPHWNGYRAVLLRGSPGSASARRRPGSTAGPAEHAGAGAGYRRGRTTRSRGRR